MISIDSQTATNLLLGVVGLITALGLFGTVVAFWSMGRSAYRKD